MSKEKFIEAVKFATDIHQDQKRKLTGTPYILHSMEVAAILASLSTDDDVIISGFLHDVVEDTPGTMEEIYERFGETVGNLVKSETEIKREDQPAELTWKIRKEESLEDLKKAEDINVKKLWLSDKLANLRSIWRSWVNEGDSTFNHFHQKDKKEHEWYYRKVAEYTSELEGTPAYIEFIQLLEIVFKD